MAHALLRLVLLVFTTSLLFETNHGLRIEVNSGGPYSDLLPSEVSISCLTDDEGDDVKEIEILQITRHGDQHWLAYVSRKTDHFDTKPGSDIAIHGQVDNKDIKQNYLNLTFPYPKEDDSGTYTCVQFYIDQEQTLLQKKASATLVVDGVSKVLQGLIQKISTLEHDLKTALNTECSCNDSIAALEETIHKQAKQIENAADKGEHLKEGVTLLEETVTRHSTLIKELEEKQPDKGQACKDCTVEPRIEERLIRLEDMYRNQTQIVTELDNKASYSVAFSASLMDNFVPVEGHVVVFDLPKINQGQGYDQQSGIFTSPADGIYAFQLTGQLHANGNLSGTVNLGIVVNSIMVAKLILDTENSKQGSVSDVVTLTKGDQVKVITIAVDNKSVEHKLALYYNEYTIFSGYLVKQI